MPRSEAAAAKALSEFNSQTYFVVCGCGLHVGVAFHRSLLQPIDFVLHTSQQQQSFVCQNYRIVVEKLHRASNVFHLTPVVLFLGILPVVFYLLD